MVTLSSPIVVLLVAPSRAEGGPISATTSKLERSASACVPITTLAPEPYEVIQPFYAVIRPRGKDYVASFLDANVNATGSTQEEAIWNLKDTIVAVFDMLSRHDPAALGPAPARQLRVLQQFLKRSG
jgi:predicted RNase H-like HicB family nuclease